ncbi:MAG TPA: patatin, partial [Clostridiaceae bacterium]|nr:patatin [Clostridiaceae bacterium]
MFGGVILKGYGVVLGGGGARGGYEIGVWKALRELQIPIAAVTGTSVGALNGAMMVQGDYDIAEEIWMSVTADSIINMENEIASAVQDKKKSMSFINTIKFMITSKGLDITPLKELLLKVIDEEKIRRSETDLGIVTFSLTDFKPVQLFKRNIPEGKLVDYLLASACFPAFKIQEIDNKKFIDGGVYDNMPVSLIIRKNIKNIIAVDISTIELIRKIDSKGLNIINIKNSQDLGGILSFDSERSKRNMEIGYYDALKAFHKYDGKKYFIIPSKDYGLYRRG